ncbi:ABC transporter permease [Polycladidibacter hongkongensis]|uniref:ABC transporter permease n=1 Tax=Polycladidibacter hongkongensis TaxID=1647556 RepID=UPI000834744E|nr:ABC transporter permease [Pseudovibrio hongkongensis]
MSVSSQTPGAKEAENKFVPQLQTALRKSATGCERLGLSILVPLLRISAGENPRQQSIELSRVLLLPLIGILAFLLLWGTMAPRIQTSLGAIPGPAAVWAQAENLWQDHQRERDKATAFYERQEARNVKLIAAGKPEKVKQRKYTGKPTYLDQIVTSLFTVSLGFVIATVVAVPLGIACGLSRLVNGAMSSLIQIFKPVSPLAWLPIVTMVVSATYAQPWEFMPKSLLVSAVTVTLCSLWPTLINTALGVASLDKDLMNVGRVLQLSTFTTIRKLVLPSSLPLIFTGLRLSLGVGWMVLIAAEMLAQNPGLGKFVWDEFQNGSSQSLARIILAVLTIGLIGFLLDRLMYALQNLVSHSEPN